MSKCLSVPKELEELMWECRACIECRDECIASLFKAKKAITYGVKAEKVRVKFWRLARELYPEVCHGMWTYSFDTGMLTEDDVEKQKGGELTKDDMLFFASASKKFFHWWYRQNPKSRVGFDEWFDGEGSEYKERMESIAAKNHLDWFSLGEGYENEK